MNFREAKRGGASPLVQSGTKTGIHGQAPYLPLLSGGNLNNARNGGPFYVNANNALTNANWNVGSRNSG